MKKNTALGIELLLFFLVLTSLVTAIGIRPASTEISSDFDKQYSGTIWVVNNDKLNFVAEIVIDGEMAQYVKVDIPKLIFTSEIEYLPVNFKVELNSSLPPGTHYAYINIIQELADNNPDVISSKLILKHKIVIFGEYPDKFIKTDVDYTDLGDKIKISSEINNLGKEEVTYLYTSFNIQGNPNQSIENLTTESLSLPSQENTVLSTEVQKSKLGEGEFIVSAITYYDDLEVEVSKKMILGKPEIDITYFDKYFLSGEINPYTLELFNKWNQKVEDVYVDINLLKNNLSVDQFRTKSVEINKFSRKQIQDYLDARKSSPGEYLFEMTVNYWNSYKMDKKTFTGEFLTQDQYGATKLSSNSSLNHNSNSNLAGEAALGANQKMSTGIVAIIIISVMLILLIASYVIYRYIHRDEYEI